MQYKCIHRFNLYQDILTPNRAKKQRAKIIICWCAILSCMVFTTGNISSVANLYKNMTWLSDLFLTIGPLQVDK